MIFSFLSLRIAIVHNIKASKWLSLLLFLYAMYLVPYMLGYAGWYSDNYNYTADILFFIPFMQVLLIGPVVYFYTKSLLNTSFKLSKRDYVHFLPALLYMAYSLVVFITDILILDNYYFYADGKDKDLSNWYQSAGLVSMAIYLLLSLRYYAHYKKLLFDKISYADSVLLQWVQNFMIALLVILVLRVLFFILNPEWGNFGNQFWHYIAFSFVFYYIAITGYSNAVKQIALDGEKLKTVNVFEEESTKLERSNSTKEDENNYAHRKQRLSVLMLEHRLFENPKLALSDVAKELGTTTREVSSTVNIGFKMNFNDFVNHYRIEAVKKKLKEGEQNTSTLLGIALDCGFNSKATFNRAFKKETQLTPKDYLETIAKD